MYIPAVTNSSERTICILLNLDTDILRTLTEWKRIQEKTKTETNHCLNLTFHLLSFLS